MEQQVVTPVAVSHPVTNPAIKESIQSGYTMVQHAALDKASEWLGCKMAHASTELKKSLALSNKTNKSLLLRRRDAIMELRAQRRINWYPAFQEAAEIEQEIAPFFESSSKDKDALEDDALAQLSFQHEALRPINHIPFAIAIIAAFKVWAVPFFTVMTPILAWILPYILLKFVYALPINQEQYSHILQSLWSGNFFQPEKGLASFWSGRSVFQTILFGFSFLQSMIQPIQNAMHLYKTDTVFYTIGKRILRLSKLVRQFRQELGPLNGVHTKLSYTLNELPENDPRAAFMLIKEQPERLRIVLRDLARLELLWRMSEKEGLCSVDFTSTEFQLHGVLELSLEGGEGHASSVDLSLGSTPHAVLTGPNGGGKSSFLRGALQAVLLGHTYGVAPAKEARMPLFSWIASGLQLRDTPGQLSMFETEVKFAADCLAIPPNHLGPGLLLFDELFHSTNPPDGIRTAERFLQAVWQKSGLFSIVSTHVFSLIEAAPKSVLPICCQATEGPGGEIHYSYAVEPGICRVSSVKKVWKRFGLSAPPARPGPGTQTLSSEEKNGN